MFHALGESDKKTSLYVGYRHNFFQIFSIRRGGESTNVDAPGCVPHSALVSISHHCLVKWGTLSFLSNLILLFPEGSMHIQRELTKQSCGVTPLCLCPLGTVTEARIMAQRTELGAGGPKLSLNLDTNSWPLLHQIISFSTLLESFHQIH